jgi:hypothetical protein
LGCLKTKTILSIFTLWDAILVRSSKASNGELCIHAPDFRKSFPLSGKRAGYESLSTLWGRWTLYRYWYKTSQPEGLMTLRAPYGSLPLSEDLTTLLDSTPIEWFKGLEQRMLLQEKRHVDRSIKLVKGHTGDTSSTLEFLFKSMPLGLTQVQRYLVKWYEFQLFITSPWYSLQTSTEDSLMEYFTRLHKGGTALVKIGQTWLPASVWTEGTFSGLLVQDLDIFQRMVGKAWGPRSLYLRKQAGFLGSARTRLSKLEGRLLFAHTLIVGALEKDRLFEHLGKKPKKGSLKPKVVPKPKRPVRPKTRRK